MISSRDSNTVDPTTLEDLDEFYYRVIFLIVIK